MEGQKEYQFNLANGGCSAHLRQVLSIMFPPAYIQLNHMPPNSVCSLLSTRCWPQNPLTDQHRYEASMEPISRAALIGLRQRLDSSLVKHQAKAVGLCPIRRSIYDQLFDELIRQVTVGCIEQGLLLFRIRNELRATVDCYRKAYESGVKFGLNKAIEAEIELAQSRSQVLELVEARESANGKLRLEDRVGGMELRNKLESVERMENYYKGEITKKDQIIEQQRAIIRALSQKATGDIKSPI